jgi:WD40 repeat protein
MKKSQLLFICFFIFINIVYAKDIKPIFTLETRALVYDFVLDGKDLYVSNDMGTIEVFDLYKKKKIDEIVLPPIYTVQGERVTPKIISLDRYNGKTIFVSTTLKGFRNIWLHDGRNLKQLIKTEDKLTIQKVKFVDDKSFVLGTVGHEMILYDMSDSYKTYREHIEQSAFSDLVLSEDKQTMISSSESGRVSIIDVKTGQLINILESLNVDNIYNIDYKNGNIITAGQDRRVGVYPKIGKPYYLKSDFLVYSVALSPSGKTGIYSSGEENYLQVFNLKTKNKSDKLVGHFGVPRRIKFFNENELFSSGDENRIFYWKIN